VTPILVSICRRRDPDLDIDAAAARTHSQSSPEMLWRLRCEKEDD